ncbi:MAG: chalcone isomerase family protein [Deltaproteobacteria bacterium]|nr:chalcone isomerase family protein [Deltaproteobacteria bacterium]
MSVRGTRFRSCFVGAVLLVVAAPVAAKQVVGVDVPEHVQLGPGATDLTLNGAGVRTKIVIKVYVGGLYVAAPTHDAAAVLADPGAQRILIHMVRDLESKTLAEALREGLDANLSAAELAPLEARIADLTRMLTSRATVTKSSQIFLDYLPGTGTQVTADGQVMGSIPGEDFHVALLKIWLGAKPVDGDLKKAMLGL